MRQAAVNEFRAAGALARSGNAAAAIEGYGRAATLLPALGGWADVLSATAAADLGDTALVRRQLDRSPDTLLVRNWGWRVRVRALRGAGDLSGAAQAAQSAAREGRNARVRADAWRAAGDLWLLRGDSARARTGYESAMREDPGSGAALAAARAVADWKSSGPEGRRLVGSTLLRHGGIERGARLLEGYLSSGSANSAQRAEAHLELGEALFRARKYPEAERHLRSAAGHHPRAELLAGRAQYRQGRIPDARSTFQSVARRAARDPAAAEALFLLGDIAQDAGEMEAARDYFRRAVATGVESEAALSSVLRLAGMATVTGDPGTARRDLSAYLDGRVRGDLRAPALYWLGRSAALAGDREAAESAFGEASRADPISYYGMRALEQRGLTLGVVALPPPPADDPLSAAAVRDAFLRMGLLKELGLSDEAAFERSRMRADFDSRPEALYLVAEGWIAEGRYTEATVLGREIFRRRGVWDRRLLGIVYPLPYRELLEREARRNGVSPHLVAGLIRQESLFNSGAVSAAGAVGLMQVMPETGRMLARQVGVEGYSPALLRDADTNVRLGTRFLADQVRRYATLTEVLAAYNAGPGRVARWRSLPEYRDEDAFVERIPYAETRDYVKKVRLNAQVYELLRRGPADLPGQ